MEFATMISSLFHSMQARAIQELDQLQLEEILIASMQLDLTRFGFYQVTI